MKKLIFIITLATSFTAKAQEINEVRSYIKTLAGEVSQEKEIAQAVVMTAQKYHIDAKVLVSLLMVESTFNHQAVSRTGDLGISQINPKVWATEFSRRKLKPLDVTLLKSDLNYAIDRTGQILSLFKKAGYKHYYGVYHSKTPSLRKAYTARIQKQLSRINNVEKQVILAFN